MMYLLYRYEKLLQYCWNGNRDRKCGCTTAGSGRTGGSAAGGRIESEEKSSQKASVGHSWNVREHNYIRSSTLTAI